MLIMYSLFDKKSGTYSMPVFERSDIQAVRGLAVAVQDKHSSVSRFASDYDLYAVGSFDDLVGRVKSYDAPVFVVSCVTLVAPDAAAAVESYIQSFGQGVRDE